MSVIVKGMKMPENCIECMSSGLRTAIKCTEWTKISAGRRENERAWSCPLVDLGKHGRLVEFIDVVKTLDEDSGTEEVCFGDIMRAYYEMRNAPSIVEAEDGE